MINLPKKEKLYGSPDAGRRAAGRAGRCLRAGDRAARVDDVLVGRVGRVRRPQPHGASHSAIVVLYALIVGSRHVPEVRKLFSFGDVVHVISVELL